MPLEAVPAPAVHSNDSIPSSIASGAPTVQTPVESVSASSVPGSDPIVGGAKSNPLAPKIPTFPVQMYVRKGKTSHFELFFINVKYGYALSDFQFYDAWCLKRGAPLPGHTLHTVRLYNSFDPNLPPQFKPMPWHRINYLINHKDGAKEEDIQQAIWRLAKCGSTRVSKEADRLIREANLKGKNYTPGPGDLVGIICQSVGNEQPLLIEYKIPNVPPVVKAAFFPPLPSVGGLASRMFIPPFFFFSSGGGGGTPSAPEPSSLLLLLTGMLGVLISWKIKSGLQAARALPLPGVRIAELPADR